MNAINIIAGCIFVVVLLGGLAYTTYRSHEMVKRPGRKNDNAKTTVRGR